MDTDKNGEVSRKEFRQTILNRSNAKLLTVEDPQAPVAESPIVYKESEDSDSENGVPENGTSPTDMNTMKSVVSIHTGDMDSRNGEGVEMTS